MSGLALADIEVYKGVSLTQRSSDNGYAFFGGDADGIDLDSFTGVNGVSIDTGDNSDASFFVAGSLYTVVLGPVTIDTQTVYTVLGTFRLVAAESVAGVVEADVTHVAGTAQTAGDLKASLNTIDDFLDTEVAAILADTDNIQTRLPAALVNGRMSSEVMGTGTGVISDTTFFAGAINAAAIAADAIGSSELAASAANEIADAILARALTEGYSADGAAPTLQQALMMVLQMLTEFAISGTTLTVRRLDGTTTAMTFTLNDATNPSSITRAT